MKYRNNTVVTIEEIREIIDRRGLASQIREGFDGRAANGIIFKSRV